MGIDAISLSKTVVRDPETNILIQNKGFDGLQLSLGVSLGLDFAHMGDSFTTLTYILKKGKFPDKVEATSTANVKPTLGRWLWNLLCK